MQFGTSVLPRPIKYKKQNDTPAISGELSNFRLQEYFADLRGNHSTLIRQRCDNILRWRTRLIFIYIGKVTVQHDMHKGAKS